MSADLLRDAAEVYRRRAEYRMGRGRDEALALASLLDTAAEWSQMQHPMYDSALAVARAVLRKDDA